MFLGLGIGIFWYIYRDIDTGTLTREARQIKYGWLGLSVLIGMLSHISRAYRWNMLIFPMGYKPKTINTFLSVMVMYLTNMIVPRGGEFARCGVLSRYEHIPFSKLVGTMVVERITDVIALILFTLFIIMAQINVFENFLEDHPAVQANLDQLFSTRNIFIASGVFISIAVFSIIFRRQFKRTLVYQKFQKIIDDFIHGIQTIRQLKNRWLYIGHTVFIYFMWLFMLYVVF
ncbi:MAG: lysylphosphatidylglycerol synthase transmembrane domain-containing protein [Bacteroidota bacterium]